MRNVILLTLLFICQNAFAQESVNEYDKKGNKKGIWKTLDKEGRIETLMMYEPRHIKMYKEQIQKRIDNFMFDGFPLDKDSIYCKDGLLWVETFIYDSLSNRTYVKREDNIKSETSYFFGPKKEIKINQRSFQIEGKKDGFSEITFEIANCSDSKISLTPIKAENAKNLKHIHLKKGESKTITARFKMKDGLEQFEAIYGNEDVELKLHIESLGFTVSSSDIDKGDAFTVPRTFHYARKGNDALLNVKDVKSKSIVKRIPLSKRIMLIDLSELPAGKYFFEKVNYAADSKRVCHFVLK